VNEITGWWKCHKKLKLFIFCQYKFSKHVAERMKEGIIIVYVILIYCPWYITPCLESISDVSLTIVFTLLNPSYKLSTVISLITKGPKLCRNFLTRSWCTGIFSHRASFRFVLVLGSPTVLLTLGAIYISRLLYSLEKLILRKLNIAILMIKLQSRFRNEIFARINRNFVFS